jgi:hypothetical protein
MTGQITTAQINQNCSTCLVYMWGSKKHVLYTSAAAKHVRQLSHEHMQQESNVPYTCAAAKNMCGSKVMNMCG